MDFGEYEEFFFKISKEIEIFIKKYNVKLDKYRHDEPVWSLSFQHPEGGIATINMSKEASDKIGISQTWYYDDYENGTRSNKFIKYQIENNKPFLHNLEEAFKEILTWKLGEWDSVADDFKSEWQKNWTKNQFYSLEKDYPKPKIPK